MGSEILHFSRAPRRGWCVGPQTTLGTAGSLFRENRKPRPIKFWAKRELRDWFLSQRWKIGQIQLTHLFFSFLIHIVFLEIGGGTSLAAQWLRIRLQTQGTRVGALVQEDPTCCGATKSVSHNYWACALEPVLRNKRSQRNKKPTHRNEE